LNGYQLNSIFDYVLLILGGAMGLVLGSLSTWVQYNLLPILIICISFVVLVTLRFWTKITPFEKKLKEFEI